MQWTDRSIILSVRKFGEGSAVVQLLAANHGRYSGVVKGAFSKNNRGIYQPGNIVQARWSARLEEHMGILTCELADPVAAVLLPDPFKLAALGAMCVYLETLLPEREADPMLYVRCEALLQDWKHDREWLADYVRLELELLSVSGVGLDLSQCAATHTHERLIYVSPRSGRAVSEEAGEPYKDKLLPLPPFLRQIGAFSQLSEQQIIDGLRLTRYFLETRLFAANLALPAACERFHKLANKQLSRQTVTQRQEELAG